MFLLKIFLSSSIFLFFKIEGTPTPAVCKEKAICEWSWIPKKLCGTWYCYGVYSPVKPAWRNFWGVTNVCKSWWKGSHGISIHCQEENDWARKGFGPFYTGFYIPENLPWNVSNFQWTDGSPVDFVDWAKPGQGTNVQQPNNGAPPGQVERVVINSNHWHDVVADPGVVAIPCKKLPVRVERTFCPTTTTPAPATPAPLAMETIQMEDIPYTIVPSTVKPKNNTKITSKPDLPKGSCRVK